MTPEQLAARWLADVPRYNCTEAGNMEEDNLGGSWYHDSDALAAIARHLAPDDLVERAGKYPEILMGYSQGDMDGVMALISRQALHESADTITALLARLSALTAHVAEAREQRGDAEARMEAAEAEAATLRDRLARMEGAMREIDALDPEAGYIGACSENAIRGLVLRMGEIARAALTDGGSNG